LTLRGALLGAGNIAQAGHLPAFVTVSEGGSRCRIVAAADLCHENLEALETRLPGIALFERAEDLLEQIQPDFVDICAPPSVHAELIERALARGCHILCEKPLTTRLEDGEALARRLRSSGTVFMPGHQYHYAPAWKAIRHALSAGEIGELRFGSISIERQQANAGNRFWKPAWRTHGRISGGGILMDHGAHLFYQLRAILGDPVRISAQIATRRHFTYGVEDTASCCLDFDRATVQLQLTWASDRRQTQHRYVGSAGTICCGEAVVEINGRSGRTMVPLPAGFSADSSHSAWYESLFDDFLGRIERSDFDTAPLDEAVAALRWTAAAYDSARLARPVRLTGDPGILDLAGDSNVGE
jgi:predicted dehydrogenase